MDQVLDSRPRTCENDFPRNLFLRSPSSAYTTELSGPGRPTRETPNFGPKVCRWPGFLILRIKNASKMTHFWRGFLGHFWSGSGQDLGLAGQGSGLDLARSLSGGGVLPPQVTNLGTWPKFGDRRSPPRPVQKGPASGKSPSSRVINFDHFL